MSDDYKKGEELHSIFMPTPDQRIQTLVNTHGRLAHYTTAEAAIKILHDRCMWLRNARNMHDFSEVVYGFNQITHYFGDEGNLARFHKALDGLPKNILEDSSTLFGQWWEQIHRNTFWVAFRSTS